MTVIKNDTQKLTLAELLRLLAQLLFRLSGKNGAEWYYAFKRFLRKENPWISTKWKVWRIINVCTKKPIEEIIDLMKANGYVPGNWEKELKEIEPIITYSKVEENVYFASVTPRQVGILKPYTLREFYDRASKQGLDLCFYGDFLSICCFDNQGLEKGEWQSAAMEPYISCSQKIPGTGFSLGRDNNGGYHFGSCNGSLDQKSYDLLNNLDWAHIFRIRVGT
jgi:hypothetical protein